MPPHPEFIDEDHILCRACGFCCDGTIFNKVELEEQDDASNLSLFQITSVEGKFYFLQPCFVFDQIKGCRIYDCRPIKCRRFSCKLLSLYLNKEISPQAAIDLIERTKQLKSDLIKEVERNSIDINTFLNTRNLVDHIKSDLSSRENKITHKEVHLKCAVFSENLLKYFVRDQSAE